MKTKRIRSRPTDAAREDALASIRVLVNNLRQSARTIERRTGVTNAQVFLLQQLAGEPGLSVNDLAERAKTNQSTVSIIIARLVEAGLVRKERSVTDARTAVLVLTPEGRRLVRRAPSPPTALLLDAVASLSAPQARQLASGMRALIRALGLESQAPKLLFERDSGTRR
jgi:DNA-binding MarR family transcriptional regulator